MFSSHKHFLLGSAILLTSLPVLAAEESSGVGAPLASLPHASIKCPGMSSVPMTADAEQALPMRLVTNLICGEKVAILADNEGYTARIRTSAGKEGYVARMYLGNEADAITPRDSQPTSAAAVNGVVRWQAGAPGFDQFATKGHTVESATADGITVQVSLEDTGWKLRATIAITNKSQGPLEVLPVLVSLDELQPGLKPLLALDSSKLSRALNHQVLRTEALAQPSPSALGYHSASGATLTTASYRPSTPDYFAERSVPSVAEGHEAGTASASTLQALALKHATLAPGQTTAGAVWFERDPNARELSLRVPAGNLVFDFPLSFDQKR